MEIIPNILFLRRGIKIKSRIVILSPHLDDAAFSLGGFLLNSKFQNLTVINIFTISNSSINGHLDTLKVTKIRKEEDELFFNLIEGQNINTLHLDFQDAPIRLKIPENKVFLTLFNPEKYEKEIKAIFSYIAKVIKSKTKSETIIFAPLAIGNHIDHLIVREVGIYLAQKGYNVLFYEDLPYVNKFSCNPYRLFTKIKALKKELYPLHISTDVKIVEKTKALKLYISQVDSEILEEITNYHKKFNLIKVVERAWGYNETIKKIISFFLKPKFKNQKDLKKF